MMHFACARCGHRQNEDTKCGRCQAPVVHDLRESRVRHMLHDTESRWQSRRHARYIGVAAAIALVVGVATFVVAWKVFQDVDRDELLRTKERSREEGIVRLLIDPDTAPLSWAALATAGTAIGVTLILEVTRGKRRKFPYLDEYDAQERLSRRGSGETSP